MSNVYKDLTGQRFGKLVIVERIGTKSKSPLWKCKCDCGNVLETISARLVKGQTKSCGCLSHQLTKERMTTHGMTNTKIFNVWQSMKQRCVDHNSKSFIWYGGRGIRVCDEWSEFINFYNWSIENGYADHLTIDRIDNNGNYEPSNCKWSTLKEQANNKRSTIRYEYHGEKKTISQWSDVYGTPYKTIARRVRRGWSIEQALLLPVDISKINKRFRSEA